MHFQEEKSLKINRLRSNLALEGLGLGTSICNFGFDTTDHRRVFCLRSFDTYMSHNMKMRIKASKMKIEKKMMCKIKGPKGCKG